MQEQADVQLDQDVQPADVVIREVSNPRRVLITGANGFVGVFLLRELMRQTEATVHCLVRGTNALDRLRSAIAWYRLTDDIDLSRVVIETGDVAQPGIGLPQRRFDYLATSIDAIYHAAAQVNSGYTYAEIRNTNVLGTHQILRLAAQHRSVPVHFTSTGSVFPALDPGAAPWRPSDVTGPVTALRTGYSRSKWVAEQVLRLAGKRGLPVSVYRIDRVWGDQRHGAGQTDDFWWLGLKGCIQASAIPEAASALFTLVPVDYAAAALVALSLQPESAGRILHLSTATPFSLTTAADWLRDMGYRLDRLPAPEWSRQVQLQTGNAAGSLADVFHRRTSMGNMLPTAFDVTETDKALTDFALVCPPITRALFETYIRFQVSTGWLPAEGPP